MIPINYSAQGAVFAVRVQPGAKRSAILGLYGDSVKIALVAPPVDGRANQALIEFLAEWLRVPRSSVILVAGAHSRSKRICISGHTAAQLQTALEAALPSAAKKFSGV